MKISIQVPARICFFGDHQDYLGLPVIAGSINRFIYLKAEPIPQQEFNLNLPDIGKSRCISLTSSTNTIPRGDYLLSSLEILKKNGLEFKQGYRIEISGDIPVNAGLSSSSALTVAWIRFLVAIQENKKHINDAQIGQWGYEAEVAFFNDPGGLMDQYTIAQQGLLCIETNSGNVDRLKSNLGDLIVAESGIPKQTVEVLKNARTFQERALKQVRKEIPKYSIQSHPPSDYLRTKMLVEAKYRPYWFAATHNFAITKQARKLLDEEHPDTLRLGELMNAHQRILENEIGNTPLEMIRMMNAARKAGAYGAKIIGSGGGGCMVAMVPENAKHLVKKAFIDQGAKNAYEVKLTYPLL